MRSYYLPPDTRDKERIFGGFFTITQFIFLALAAFFGIGGGLLLMSIFNQPIISLILGLILGAPFLPFVFIKVRRVGDMELFQYLCLKFKFKKKTKVYPNININYQEEA